MGIQDRILKYLEIHEKENKYRITSALKINGIKVAKALNELEEKGKIRIETGKVSLTKEQPKTRIKARIKFEEKKDTIKIKKPVKPEKVTPEKIEKEQPKPEISESEKSIEEEKLEGTIKFYNPNKGFGFITGDDGKDYYVHKSGLKEGTKIEQDNRVSFRVVQGDKGPKAEEVKKITKSIEGVH